MKKIVVRAPASTSNLGPGFDVFGLALDVMYDTVEILCLDKKVVLIEIEGIEADSIPINPEKNSAGKTALEFLKRFNESGGFKIKIIKGIPPGSGLGSSGASAAATAVALNHLFNLKLNKRELTEIAAQGEIASAGAPVADNVAASIYGGFVIIRSYHPLEILSFPPPSDVEFALAVPEDIKKTTRQARNVLPKNVALSKVIHNIGTASAVVAGLLLSDASLIGQGMLGDQIVEPVRISLYPGCINAKKAAIESGAFGATLSGAGPTVIAIVNREKADPAEVAKAMKEAFEAEGVKCHGYVSRATVGAQIIYS